MTDEELTEIVYDLCNDPEFIAKVQQSLIKRATNRAFIYWCIGNAILMLGIGGCIAISK